MSKDHITEIFLIIKKRNKDRFMEIANLIYQHGKPGNLSKSELVKELEKLITLHKGLSTDLWQTANNISEKYF